MRTGITSTPRVGSTSRRGEGPTPVVTRFPLRTQRRWPVSTRPRCAVPHSQAASTTSRLIWSPRWNWQLRLAGPSAGYGESPRASREGNSDLPLPIGHVGRRPSWGTPLPNDPPCDTVCKGTFPPGVWVGKTHSSVGTGGVSCRRPREWSCPVPRVGPPRTGRRGEGRPRPRRPDRGCPAVGNAVFPLRPGEVRPHELATGAGRSPRALLAPWSVP